MLCFINIVALHPENEMQITDKTALLWIVALAVLCVAITITIFMRRRSFERGPRKGEAAEPVKVKRENPKP
jgi:cytochrome c-type biogenesis protein CcmH/NrfF